MKMGEVEDELQEFVLSNSERFSRRAQTAKRVTPTTFLFPPATIAADGGPTVVEMVLQNGDVYKGEFAGNVPHGVGKYLWSDGCMYEGEWVAGKRAGKGKFSWSSGATYEGEFRAGFMHGFGTFTGIGGDSYRGMWAANKKQGFGRKAHGNGDRYEGYWKQNLHEGEGKYVWKNGNVYDGEWRSGVMWGKGVLIWGDGRRYEGRWENGAPTGGVFSWLDGCSFRRHNSSFAYRALPTQRLSADGMLSGTFDRICIWESDGEAGDITCDIVDGNAVFWKEESDRSNSLGLVGKGTTVRFPGEAKKQGLKIYKGHRNYELMLNLQLGIRYSVGKSSASLMQELKPADFDPKQRAWIRFPAEGSKITPPHQSMEFRWKDYCPTVFWHLRSLFKIDPGDYMLSICGNDAFRELSSPGKSGSSFYLTHDDRFMIKTVKKSEVKVLLRMLPSYYNHIRQFENSLMTKFYGVHCLKHVGDQKLRFIVMGNVFCSEHQIHRRFDLKGSSYGRSTDKAVEEIDETTTLKDLDLDFVFRLERSWFHQLLKQIDSDCHFLEAERIMDYSLLVGLHFCNPSTPSMRISKDSFCSSCRGREDLVQFCEDKQRSLSARKALARLGANMPARVEQVSWRSDSLYIESDGGGLPAGDVYDVILYLGIIDILQDYNISKKLEHAYKSIHVDPTSISAVDPKLYSKRFRDFISRVFMEDC